MSKHILENLQGIFIGHYNVHGFEIIQVEYQYDAQQQTHSLYATKLTGDTYVPAGKPTFQILQVANDDTELPFIGQGHIANGINYMAPMFIPGRLISILPDFSAFVFEWLGLGSITFVRRQANKTQLHLDADEEMLCASLMRDYMQTASMEDNFGVQYAVGSSKALEKQQLEQALTGVIVADLAAPCVICMCELEKDEMASQITKCKHVFHTECITKWLIRCAECPLCKVNLK